VGKSPEGPMWTAGKWKSQTVQIGSLLTLLEGETVGE
jgi:hypothetical protein